MPPPAAFVPREPDGIGVGKPAHPFAATVEAQVPVSPFSNYLNHSDQRMQSSQMDMESSIMRIILLQKVFCTSSPNTMTQLMGSLPTGTQLPGGAVLPMSSVADFPMVLPEGMPPTHWPSTS